MLGETAADVAALIPRHAWLLMDEEQRDVLMRDVVLPRYMETTTDGVALGPTWWAQAVGATAEAIRARVQRLRQGQSQTGAERSRALSDSRVRHARSALREAEPEVVERIVAELPPARRDVVANAVARADAYEGRVPTEGTAAEYLRNPAPDPGSYEIDHLALDLARRARELRDRVRRFGVRTMAESSDTLRDLDSAIADASEARAAVQEHINEAALQ
jgi:hypothetical protein